MIESAAKPQLKQRILQKLSHTTLQSTRCIRNVLEVPTFFYIPSISACTALVLEWIKCCPGTVIVTKKPLSGHRMLGRIPSLGLLKDISRGHHTNYLVAYSELAALPSFSKVFCVIFEDVEDVKLLQKTIGEDVVSSFMFRFATTSNPLVFAQFLQARSDSFSPFVPERYIRRSYIGEMLSTASIIYHPECLESPQALDYLSYMSRICDQRTMELFQDIFKRNLFDSRYFRKFVNVHRDFTSEKLVELFKSLKYLGGSPVCIYFDNAIDRQIAYEILKSMVCNPSPSADPMGLDCIESFFSRPADAKVLALHGRLLEECSIPIDLKLVTDISRYHSSAGVSIIFFNYCPLLSRCFRIYLCPLSHNGLFREMIECDNRIRRSLSENMGSSYRRTPTRKQPLCKVQVLGEVPDEMAGSTSTNGLISKVERIGSKVLVTTRSFNDELVASFNLLDAIKQPILLSRCSVAPGPLFCLSDGFELCTITSLKSLVNPKAFCGSGFLAVLEKSICIYSFSKDRNLRLDLSAEDMDEYVILSIAKSSHGSPGNSLFGRCLLISITLKTPPRIYSIESSEDIAKKLSDDGEVSDKCMFFSKLEWKRLSASEFPEFVDRFDLRVSVPLSQSTPIVELPVSSYQKAPRDDCGRSPYGLEVSIVRSLVRSLGNYHVRIVCSELIRSDALLSLDDIKGHFLRFDFDFCYPIICLISRKGRFLVGRLTKQDVDYISQQHIPSYCEALDCALRSRFEPLNVRVDCATIATQRHRGSRIMIRTAIVTPLRVIFNYEMITESNRVLRHFDPDKFLRVSMREEDGKGRFSAGCRSADNIYEYFRNVMLGGITVGTRRYFFLAMTASQLKAHGSWFVTPYEYEGTLVGADYIKSWLGDFSSIKNIGKYAVRVGLALSSTTRACTVEDFIEVDDVERGSYCFTDGVGLITQRCASAVSNALGLGHVPSAFQIRFAGYKGVLVAHPWLSNKSSFHSWLSRNSIVKGHGKYSGHLCLDSTRLGAPDVIFRKSMNKFDSSHRDLEIVAVSKSCDFYLNRQIIMTLEGLGVPPQVFLDLQDRYVYKILSELHSDFPAFIRKHCHVAFNVSSDFVLFRKLQSPILSEVLDDLSSKSKIFVEEGRGAMGVIDDLDVLEENQVFFMFKRREHEDMASMVDYGAYAVPNCQCIVAKNPVMHPGDIRVVRCVDNPRLHYLKDVLVFSQRGLRPVFNQCSGSDLDGDVFLLSWCKRLIPKATFRPYDYRDSSGLVKDRVLLSDIVNFYIRHMRLYQLGQIANSHLATSDKYTIFNERSLKLSEIFNKSIDYVKTGSLASVPDDLKPVEFPDFMEKAPSYYSKRVLGMLYRRSCIDLSGIGYCECARCILKEIRGQPRWKELILMGSGAKTREIAGSVPYTDEDLGIFRSYKRDVLALANKYGVKSEEKLFCYRGEDVALVSRELRSLVDRHVKVLRTRESLRMAEIGRCQSFNSTELLCGDAYRLKSVVKRGIVEDGSSHFAFNSKVHLIDHGIACDSKIALVDGPSEHDFYDNKLDATEIAVHANVLNYKSLVNSLDAVRKDIFREAFNLIVLSKLYKITEVDRIIDLLAKINSRMVHSDRLEFFRSALPDSSNVLFKIAALIVLDLSIVKKSLLLREKEPFTVPEAPRAFSTCKRICLVVSGMFDGNDDVEFTRRDGALVPLLKNKGICSPDYYKDTLRDFLVNILYSGENARFISFSPGPVCQPSSMSKRWRYISGCGPNDVIGKTSDKGEENESGGSALTKVKKCDMPGAHYELIFTPGKFCFSSVPEHSLNDCFSIRELERLLVLESSCGSFSFDFTPCHDALISNRRRDVRENLSFVYRGLRYSIQYVGSKLTRITKDRAVIGKAFIVNDPPRNDLQVEFVRDRIVFEEGIIDMLKEHEYFMKHLRLSVDTQGCCKLGPLSLECTDVQVERISVHNDLVVSCQSAYTWSSDSCALEPKEDRISCFASSEFSIDSIDSSGFNRAFSKLWRVYVTTLCPSAS